MHDRLHWEKTDYTWAKTSANPDFSEFAGNKKPPEGGLVFQQLPSELDQIRQIVFVLQVFQSGKLRFYLRFPCFCQTVV